MELEDIHLSPEEKRQIQQPEPEFKGVFIPKEIWENPELSALEKCLLTQIYYYSKKGNPCFASNSHLAKFINKSVSHTKNMISILRKKGYIEDCGYSGGIRKIRAIIPVW